METKLFEIRDRMTFIPVICIKCDPGCDAERYLLSMSGYRITAQEQQQWILMGRLQDGELRCTPSDHAGYPNVRTMWMAHEYIEKHWNDLRTGDVVDIEFILKESPMPKISQRLEEC